MKVLAKTTGATLVCASGDFLDSYKYRIVEYDNQARDWNNRNLLDIKAFIPENVSNDELNEIGLDAFIVKYVKVTKAEVKEEEKAKPEVKEEEEEVPVQKKNKLRRNKR